MESAPTVTIARSARPSTFVPPPFSARSARSSTASVPETPVSPLLHLVDEELSPSEEDFIPRKRRSVDVDDGITRAVDSTRSGHEPTTAMLEDDANLLSEVPPSKGIVEGVPFPNAEVGVGGPPMEVVSTMLRDKPPSSRLVDVPASSIDERGKGIARTVMRRAPILTPMRFGC